MNALYGYSVVRPMQIVRISSSLPLPWYIEALQGVRGFVSEVVLPAAVFAIWYTLMMLPIITMNSGA